MARLAKFSDWVTAVQNFALAAEVAGSNPRVTTSMVQQAIETAVEDYQRHRPRKRVGYINGDSGFDYDMPFGWVDGFSSVFYVEHPLDDSSGVAVENQDPDSYQIHEHRSWEVVQVRDDPLVSRDDVARLYQVDDTPTDNAFVEETTDANDAGEGDVTLFPSSEAVGDYVAIGYASRFDRIIVDGLGGTAGVAGVVVWEYWDGAAWRELAGVVDETSGFTAAVADGLVVSWDVPANWATLSLNSTTAVYYVRARITTVYTTNPVVDQVFIGTVATASQLRFIDREPSSDEWVKVRFYAPHVVDANVSTVPATDERVVARYAAAIALEQLASFYVSTKDPNINAESVNFRTKEQEARGVANVYRQDYYRHLGLKKDGTQSLGIASTVVSIRATDPFGQDRLLHPRRLR